MNDREAFLRTIVAHPNDDTPRLVYADWLEEQGDERSEFIRVQIDLARMGTDDVRKPDCINRELELLKEHGDKWLHRLKPLINDHRFRRGFIDTVALPGRKFLSIADALFELAPIQHLRLTHLGMGNFPAAKLASMPHLAGLDSIELAGVAGDERIGAILQSGYLKQINRLQLDHVRCGQVSLQVICGGSFPKLQALELIGDEFGAWSTRLIRSPHLLLKELSLKASSGGAIDRDAVVDLARARNLAALTLLDLRNHHIRVPGATAIAKSKVLTQLEVLGLRGCAIGVHGMQALAESANLARLTTLNVGANHFGINGLRAIVNAPWERLTSLNLAGNNLDDRCIALLLEWPGLERLRFLNLADNQIQDAALAELISAPDLRGIWCLNLGIIADDSKAAEALRKSPHLAASKSQFPNIFGFGRINRSNRDHIGNRVNLD